MGDDNDVRMVVKEVIVVMNEGVLLIDYIIVFVMVVKEIDRVCKDYGLGFFDVFVFGG